MVAIGASSDWLVRDLRGAGGEGRSSWIRLLRSSISAANSACKVEAIKPETEFKVAALLTLQARNLKPPHSFSVISGLQNFVT